MPENPRNYKIKVPVYVSEAIKRDEEDVLWTTSVESMISDVKVQINIFNNNPNIEAKNENRAKTSIIGINHIEALDLAFNTDKCLLLRVTAYKTNLVDGFYQSEDETNVIRFRQNDKICSDTYYFILYPSIYPDPKTTNLVAYWHIFVYEDPTKANDDMSRIARLIMSKIIKVPIKNIKAEKLLNDIKRFKLISEVEITLSSIEDNDDDIPTYIKSYDFQSKVKKEKKITLNNMSSDDAINIFNDDSFRTYYSKKQVKFIMANRRVFNIMQEFSDKFKQTLEDSFNYSIDITEDELKNNSIFQPDTIKKNVEGIFTRYMANTSDE